MLTLVIIIKIIIIIYIIIININKIKLYVNNKIFIIYNKYISNNNHIINNFISNMDYIKINNNYIPEILKNKLNIINVHTDYYNKYNDKKIIVNKILDKIKNKKLSYPVNKINIIDYLDYKTKYYFGPHTDIEWNIIDNDGYQVWYLIKNNNTNNYGNMFIIYNEYLYKKYKKIYYSLNIDKKNKKKILVIKNCRNILEKNNIILETLDIDWFKKNTKIFYLDFKPGDCLIFNKNLLHMSDTRGNKTRHAINFRVIKNKLKIKYNNCGFIKDKNIFYKQ